MKVGLWRCQGSSHGSRWVMLVIVTKSVIALGSASHYNKAAWNSSSETPDPCLFSVVSGTGTTWEVNPTWHSDLELPWGFSLWCGLPAPQSPVVWGQSSLSEGQSQSPRTAGVGRELCFPRPQPRQNHLEQVTQE